ncbi:MAG: phosphoserine phosphatase SerB [Pseudomonadales bacterium]
MNAPRAVLTVRGPEHPALLSTVCAILAEQGVALNDVSQSVLQGQVLLTLVHEATEDAFAPVQQALEAALEPLGARVSSAELTAAWDRWAQALQEPRIIVTVLARRLGALEFAALTAPLAALGLRVEALRRLSSPAAAQATQQPRACVEFALRGSTDQAELRAAMLEVAQRFDLDVAVQRDDVYRRNRRLVAFDMDSTLIETEVIDELARRAGVGDAVAAITEQAMRGELDFQESFRARVALLKGLPEAALDEIAKALPLSEGAERLVSALHRLGYKTAIISGGFQFFGEQLKARLGIDYVFANELPMDDGVVTGAVARPIVDGARKAELLQALAAQEGLALEQVIAIGDGANDLPMLAAAGLGIAYRAKPLVRARASHAISTLGLDGLLYLLGFTDDDFAA